MTTESEVTLGDIFSAIEEAEGERTRIIERIDNMDESMTNRIGEMDTLLVQVAAGVHAISLHLGITADVLEAANRAVANRR